MNKVTDNGASPLYVSSMNWYYDVVRVMVIQLTEFRLKGWNRHVLRFCRENHPGGVEVRERRKDTSERSDVE